MLSSFSGCLYRYLSYSYLIAATSHSHSTCLFFLPDRICPISTHRCLGVVVDCPHNHSNRWLSHLLCIKCLPNDQTWSVNRSNGTWRIGVMIKHVPLAKSSVQVSGWSMRRSNPFNCFQMQLSMMSCTPLICYLFEKMAGHVECE